jgi:YVTN family beta-propeller protein
VWAASGSVVQAFDAISLTPLLTLEVDIPTGLGYGAQRVWAGDLNGSLLGFDPLTARQVITVESPFSVGEMNLTFDGQTLWVGNSVHVYPIDPLTGMAGDPIRIGRPIRSLAVADGRLWVGSYEGELREGRVSAIDLQSRQLITTTSRGASQPVVESDGRRLWVAYAEDNAVQALDFKTSQPLVNIPVGRSPAALVFDGTRLWVANHADDTIQAIYPALEGD